MLYKNTLLILISTLTHTSIFNMSTQQEKAIITKENAKELALNSVIGGATGTIEVLATQPFLYGKNKLQQGQSLKEIIKEVSLHFRMLYRGCGISIVNMAPTTAIQITTHRALHTLFSDDDLISSTLCSFASGTVSALASTPTELVILHQQNNGQSAYQTVRKIVATQPYSVLYRGVTPKAFREGLFTIGFFSLYPSIKNQVHAHVIDNNAAAVFIAGASTGLFTSVISHPFDTISTIMQADYERKNSTTMLQTAQHIHKKHGYRGFSKGATLRSLNIALSIPIMTQAQQTLNTLARGNQKYE